MTLFKDGESVALLTDGGRVRVDGVVVGHGVRDVTVRVEVFGPNVGHVGASRAWIMHLERLLREVTIHGTDEAEGGRALDDAIRMAVDMINQTADVPDGDRTLRREGWRARLVAIEALLKVVEEGYGTYDGSDDWVRGYEALQTEAIPMLHAMIDGDEGTDGLVKLSRDDVDRLESWLDDVIGQEPEDDALLDRLRREVGA